MERDLDLAREILMAVEKMPYTGSRRSKDLPELQLPGRTKEAVRYHTAILHEAGLIYAVDIGNQQLERFTPFRLTWVGHEFLDKARDDTRWDEVRNKAGGLGFDVIRALLMDAAKAVVGSSLGGEPDCGKSACSSLRVASSCIPGSTWLYVSKVNRVVA